MSEYVQPGIAPSARKTVCIDFDGTIVPWGPLKLDRDPFPGVANAIWGLHDAGYRVVILTSRLSRAWWRAEAKERGVDVWDFGLGQKLMVQTGLKMHDIYFDQLTAEKVPAVAYIDDRAVRVDEQYDVPRAIGDFLHGLYEVARPPRPELFDMKWKKRVGMPRTPRADE
jgi:hypothetical protein